MTLRSESARRAGVLGELIPLWVRWTVLGLIICWGLLIWRVGRR